MGSVNREEMADIEAQTQKQHEAAAIFKKSNLPVTLKFVNVQYKVKPRETAQSCSCNKENTYDEEKVILKGITGLVLPGEMLAMLGPSGSGKTTLLSALGGRLGSGHLYGDITFNGKSFSNPMRRNTGFVTQDDVLYPHLTVTETLVFTALLRLPNTMNKQEKIESAEAVVHQLDLIKCKNSIIGDQYNRGVSGGERKRVSIGQEMLINPSVLFLDEPTSGLDSTTAQRIVRNLSELAKGGRTVVMTIHQPSSRLFYMFDKVLLLSDGNSLYFGAGSRVMDYFASVGHAPSVLMNPADFLLDLANGVPPNDDSISSDSPVMVKQALVSAYKSNIAPALKSDFQEMTGQQHHNGPNDKQSPRWSTTWWQQFTVLLRRGLKERKYESFSNFKIGQVLVVAFIAGLLWWQTHAANIQDKTGLLFFSSGFWGFFPLFQAIFTFPQERKMLEKERSAGTYRLSSYFMSRMVCDLPMELVLPTLFVTITYWMAGLQPSAGHFFHTLFVLLYSVLVSQGLGLAIGALVMDQKSATTLGSVIMLTFLLAGGYYVQHVPPFIGWIKYISLSQYTYKLLLGSQFKHGDTYPCNAAGGICLVDDFPGIEKVGLDGQVIDAVVLGIMLVFYRVIAYLALMRIGVMKKWD